MITRGALVNSGAPQIFEQLLLVGEEGLEPSSLAATDFKSVVYTDSTTLPGGAYRI